ncbi:cytochrome P450 [Wolfiporia cocos MD-104 SS10]|uniref:Cytochrome P450 n=1 Tax=Wolfiporia cocos (strain MD-104) TaxID=742152 RepID=A0A2H3JCX7_WOLCO|nr:cytochrome P450 [Wolfiporia cocos MD-104 SS10]
MDALRPHLKLLEWAQEYGEIFSLRIGPQPVIVLNTAKAANTLMLERGAKYSGRVAPHVAHDLVRDGQSLLFMQHDQVHKSARRSLQTVLGPKPSQGIRPIQDLESRVLLYDLCAHGEQSISKWYKEGSHNEDPEHHWFGVVRRFTSSVVLNVMLGRRVHRLYNNPDVHKIYDVVENFARVSQFGSYLVDIFPILRKLPDVLAPWRREGLAMHQLELSLYGGFLDEGHDAVRKGIARHGFINTYLRARANAGQESAPGKGVTENGWMRDKQLLYVSEGVIEAGSDTTASTIQSFVLFMLAYPSVLQRAREEVDAAVGAERMPNFEDEERLPYVCACVKEILRRRPPTPMGIPHKAEEDDFYQGYFIPKGSTVWGNVWAIHMDPERFPNPMAFEPEHYLTRGKQETFSRRSGSSSRDHYVFGWGRRFCQGSYIAEASIFIALSRLIWGIDFYGPIDNSTAQPWIPDTADDTNWTEGFVTGPKMFPVGFRARSRKHAEVIEKSFVDAQAEWQTMGLAADER